MNTPVSWIKLPVNFYKLPEIEHIASLPHGKTYVALYPKLLCLAGELNMRGCFVLNNTSFTIPMLAKALKVSVKTMTNAVDAFTIYGILAKEKCTYYIPQWSIWQSADRLDKIRERDRARKRKAREDANHANLSVLWQTPPSAPALEDMELE